MAEVPAATLDGPGVAQRQDFRLERTIQRGDTTYDLFIGDCTCCDQLVHRLMRTSGASTFSVYQISAEAAEHLDDYVDQLHDSFAVDVQTKIAHLRSSIRELNSDGYFQAEEIPAFRVRLLDKARLLCARLSENGVLSEICDHPDDIENNLSAAFLLGCLATEFAWLDAHEDAVFEGWAHKEGRETGRPLAVAARLRQGKRTRKAVLEAAQRLYEQNSALRRNDSKTAKKIEEMKLDSLRKRDGTYLGSDAIVKHLRALRN